MTRQQIEELERRLRRNRSEQRWMVGLMGGALSGLAVLGLRALMPGAHSVLVVSLGVLSGVTFAVAWGQWRSMR